MTEKNFELLRPFDLEAAKRGDGITDSCGGKVVYIDGPDAAGNYAVRIDGHFAVGSSERLRMAPLCWVEGRPVYKGDVLYMTVGVYAGKPFVPHQFNGGMLINLAARHHYRAEYLTWTPPKVKREGWVNIYKLDSANAWLAITSVVYKTQEFADKCAQNNRVGCVHIEWEEDVKEAA